jgi:hypothetical protein
MKPITIHVSEPLYALFQSEARKRDRKTAELIRDAMESYLERGLLSRPSLDSWEPLSLGEVRHDWADASFRDEMLADRYAE